MKCFLSANSCIYYTSQNECQSSFSSWEFLRKTSWLLTPVVTFTNSRLVAVHRRKQAVTKMNDGGCRGGRASGKMGSLSISKFHFQIGGAAAKPAGSTSSHHLSDCLGKLMALSWLLMNLFVSESGRWGSATNMSTYQTSSSTEAKREKGCEAKKKRKKKAPTTISEAWKVISDWTCQEVYGRFTQSYEKERRKPED